MSDNLKEISLIARHLYGSLERSDQHLDKTSMTIVCTSDYIERLKTEIKRIFELAEEIK
jgi:hypothetical protein